MGVVGWWGRGEGWVEPTHHHRINTPSLRHHVIPAHLPSTFFFFSFPFFSFFAGVSIHLVEKRGSGVVGDLGGGGG